MHAFANLLSRPVSPRLKDHWDDEIHRVDEQPGIVVVVFAVFVALSCA